LVPITSIPGTNLESWTRCVDGDATEIPSSSSTTADHALRRLLMVLNAYVDASGKGDPKLLVLAGYIATAETWIEFSKEWQSRLDQAGMPYFKMNDAVRSRPGSRP
jgi:hypothetical protein